MRIGKSVPAGRWVSTGLFTALATLAGVANAAFIDRVDAIYDNSTGLLWEKAPTNILRDWTQANAYADGLTLAGVDDWRLPQIGELQGLYNEILALGNCGGAQLKDCTGNQSPFTDLQFRYWSANTSFNFIWFATTLTFGDGDQDVIPQNNSAYAWAVRTGDVRDVPEPGSGALLGVGLLTLAWYRRRSAPQS